MNALVSALRELWGLLVEDATLTIGIVASLLIAAFVFPAVIASGEWRGPALFVLLALVLFENVRRTARRR